MSTLAAAAHALDNGRITVAETQADIDETLARWRAVGPQKLAHDLECAASGTVANGTGLHPHLGVVRLAQFAVNDGGDGRPEALVIDAWRLDPRRAYALLSDPRWPVIVHFAQMEQRWHGWARALEITNLLDTCDLSKQLLPVALDEFGEPLLDDDGRPIKPSHSLAACIERDLGRELDKSEQNSAWDAVRLRAEQLQYAGYDVLSLLDLEQVLVARLQQLPEADQQRIRQTLDEKQNERARKSLAAPTAGRPDERTRLLGIIRAARDLDELEEISRSLRYARLHHGSRESIGRALRRARQRLRSGERVHRPVPVRLAGWQRPF